MIYGIFDILGELGGVQLILNLSAFILIGPISEFSFYLKSIAKLFLLKSSFLL
jgi:hypothetical protein